MEKVDVQRLLRAALQARRYAVARHSGFRVGAALWTRRGRIVTGANVESDSYSLTCCAERVALFKALTDGETDFRAIAVVARIEGGPAPCGACRQLLMDFAPQAEVWIADSRRLRDPRRFTVPDLLPHPFQLGRAANPSEGRKRSPSGSFR
jgi:cytidine deaminase